MPQQQRRALAPHLDDCAVEGVEWNTVYVRTDVRTQIQPHGDGTLVLAGHAHLGGEDLRGVLDRHCGLLLHTAAGDLVRAIDHRLVVRGRDLQARRPPGHVPLVLVSHAHWVERIFEVFSTINQCGPPLHAAVGDHARAIDHRIVARSRNLHARDPPVPLPGLHRLFEADRGDRRALLGPGSCFLRADGVGSC